jgi:diaminopimelate epimerase
MTILLSGVEFFKIEGSGNDFIAILDTSGKILRDEIPKLAKILCDRNKGVGGDGIIIAQRSDKADLRMIYYNSDGSHAALCGNGLRALGLLSHREKLTTEIMKIETDAGVFNIEVTGGNSIRNSFNPAQIKAKEMTVELDGQIIKGNHIDVGIPYFCVHVKSEKELLELDVKKTGAIIRNHAIFCPAGTNVTFISIGDPHNISIRIFERGIEGETLSSGTGSYSSAVSSVISGLAKPPVKVKSPGGSVVIGFDYRKDKIENPWLEGPANIVFRGQLLDL